MCVNSTAAENILAGACVRMYVIDLIIERCSITFNENRCVDTKYGDIF